MGASQLKQDWKQHYTKLNTNSQPLSTIIQHNTTQKKFELISISINQQTQKTNFQNKLKNRQTTRPRFIRHIEQIFYKEEEQYCGTSSKFQLVYELGSNRLQSVFNQRKNKKLTFQDQLIFFIIIHIFKALKEIEALKERHGSVNMHFILLGNSVKLQDPILVENNQDDLVQAKNKNSYPSPNRLLSKVDTGMNLDFFCEDLFSLGMVALQMYLLFQNIKNVYRNKNKTYQNQRIQFNLLYQYLRMVKNPQLNECLRLLLSQIPKERTKVILLLQNLNISDISLLNFNCKTLTNQQELAQMFNPNIKSHSQQVRTQLCLPANKKNSFQSHGYFVVQQNYQPVMHVRQNSLNHVPSHLSQQQIQKQNYNIASQNKMLSNAHQKSRQNILAQSYRPKSCFSVNQNNQNKQINHGFTVDQKLNILSNELVELQPKNLNIEADKRIIQIKPASQPIIIHQQKEQKIATPIKDLSEFISPTKNISFCLQFDENNKRRTSNKNLAALQQQFVELEKLTKKNKQLKQKLNKQANKIFATKQQIPVQSQLIVQENSQDSKIEQPYYVVQQYQSGHKYEGYVQNKMRNGYGKFYYSGGSLYDGQWMNDKMYGYGQLFYSNRQLAYQGFLKNDEFQGKGTFKNDASLAFTHSYDYRNFKKIKSIEWKLYDGEWARDKKQGKGTLTLSNNQVFEGEFKQDIPHGYGIFRQLNGNKIKGVWNQGIFQQIIP